MSVHVSLESSFTDYWASYCYLNSIHSMPVLTDAHIDLYYLPFMPNKCIPSPLLTFFIWCFSQLHPISHCRSPLLIFTLLYFSLCHFLCPSLGGVRKLKLENELTAQLWRVHWEDIQMSNMEKVLRRACSKLTMSLVKGNTHTHTHFQ